MLIISVEIMKRIDQRKMQKAIKEKRKKQKGARGTEAIAKGINRSCSESYYLSSFDILFSLSLG